MDKQFILVAEKIENIQALTEGSAKYGGKNLLIYNQVKHLNVQFTYFMRVICAQMLNLSTIIKHKDDLIMLSEQKNSELMTEIAELKALIKQTPAANNENLVINTSK